MLARLLTAIWILGIATPGIAQVPGDLDPSFADNGVARIDIRVGGVAKSNVATGLAVQEDGRIVLAGAASNLPSGTGEERMVAVRLTASGALDPTFGTGGRVRVTAIPDDWTRYSYGRAALGPDGEIYLHNSISEGIANGWATARLRPNGALETGFGDAGFIGYLSDVVSPADVAVDQGGKLLLLSDFNDEGGTIPNQDFIVERFLANGDLDPTFGEDGYRTIGFNLGDNWEDYATAMALQRNGRILVAGQANVGSPPGNEDFAVARLTPDGDLDTTFSGDGKTTIAFDLTQGVVDTAYAIAVDSRGRILVGGVAGGEAAVARLLPNGTLDSSFSGDGKVTFSFASSQAGAFDQAFGIAVQGNGSVIVVGRGTTAAGNSRRFGVARLTANGALDPTFAGDGTRVYDFSQSSGALSVARAVALLEDGSILAVGGTETALDDMDFVAVRLVNDYIFADGFDRGDWAAWSVATN